MVIPAHPHGFSFAKWEVELLYRGAFAVILALVALVGLSLPARLHKDSKLMPIANAFGGGVILSAALVHMLPESSGCEVLGNFPWGPTMLAMGYLFLLSVEIVVDRIAQAAAMHSLACCRTPLIPCEGTQRDVCHGHPEADAEEGSSDASPESPSRHSPSRRILEHKHGHSCGTGAPSENRAPGLACETGGGGGSRTRRRPLAAVVATCGLSVHAFLEGLALGLRANPGDFAVICATISVHKGFAALALGAVLADGPSEAMRQAAVLAFCAATPVGIIIGSALLASTTCAVTSPLGAFSAGSLMWVALHEVISPATNGTQVFAVLCATWVGFAGMTVLAVWV